MESLINANYAEHSLKAARKLFGQARNNRVKAARMLPDCVTANKLRERADQQEDAADYQFSLVASFLQSLPR